MAQPDPSIRFAYPVLSLSKPGLGIGVGFFDEFRCRSVAAAGDSLFFCFAKSKVSKRKGDPGVCVPSLRCGHLPVLSPAGVPLELAALRQSRALIRLGFRSSAHSQGFCRGGSDSESDSEIGSGRMGASNTIAAYARITWSRGQIHLKERRAAWFLGSDRNFAAQHPQGKPKARRIWALTPKTPERHRTCQRTPYSIERKASTSSARSFDTSGRPGKRMQEVKK